MVRKVLGIGLVVLLAGALIGGGAYLLLRDASGNGGGYHRQGQTATSGGLGGRWNSAAGETTGGRRGGQGSGNAETLAVVERGGGRGRGSGNATAGGDGTGTPEANAAPEEWLTVSGIVVAMEEDLVVRTTDGTEIAFRLGPSWYRASNGATITVGDEVRVTGFYEDGELMAGAVENLSTGQSLALRDESGRPLWSGRGRH